MTGQFPNILCPVDFSERARTALGYASALADHFKARLNIVAAVSDDGRDSMSLDRLAAFVGSITARFGPLTPAPELVIRRGVPGDVILSVADEQLADLIVISTHGAGNGAMPYGSTTLHVMRHAPVPLLVIPPAVHALPPPEAERLLNGHSVVLAPVDFHLRSHRDARIAAGLAEAFGLDLLLLHVLVERAFRTEAEAASMLAGLMDEVGARTRTQVLIAAGDAAEEISRVAIARDAGVIVMGLRGDGGTRGSLPGSIAYEVLRRAAALVLALPEGRGWITDHRRERRAAVDAPLQT